MIDGGMLRLFQFSTKNCKWSQIFVIFVVSLCGLTSMAFLSWPSPAIPVLTTNSTHMEIITLEEASYFAVIPPLVTLVISPLISMLLDIIGRKKMILLTTLSQIFSWIVIILANNLTHLYISRALYGISDALIYCSIPAYIGEISTPQVRGTWGNLFMIFMFFGQFLMNVVGSYCNIKITSLIFITVPITQFLVILYLPESPYFLLIKNRISEAEQSLKWLRWNQNVLDELNHLIKDVERQLSEPGTLKHLFVIPTNRKALFICVVMRIFQQFSGLPAFAVYTQQLFANAGGKLSSTVCSFIYTGVFFVVSVTYLFVLKKLGRRPLMLFSAVCATVALFVEAIYFYLQFEADVNVASVSWIPLITMLFYILTSIGGLGMLPTLMLGELFSSSIKGKAMGLVNMSCFLGVFAVPKLFQFLTSEFGMYVPFLVYGTFTFTSIMFFFMFLPETKGKTLEQVQQSLISKEKNTKL